MRDLGFMGESAFSLWCGESGMIPNGSSIDKTGWDFLVEFPFDSDLSPTALHKPAAECRVQVKATDKKDRKLQIKLSNLRRLITAQMPSFFVFIEFDNLAEAQRVFVVHVDNDLITRVLKRLHTIEVDPKENRLNKRTMTISYGEEHALPAPNGASLKNRILRDIGDDVSKYIAQKKEHLESTGFEDGFAQFTFITEGEENLKTLIDVSIGVEKEADVKDIKGVQKRFGIIGNQTLHDEAKGKISMPDLKPNAQGQIRFRENNLSAGLTFDAKIYVSAFNEMLPNHLKTFRVEGAFFELKSNPFTGSSEYSFSLGGGIRMEVSKFRDAVKLLNLITSSGKTISAELIFEDLPRMKFRVGCENLEIDTAAELKALECAVKIMTDFGVTESIDISIDEVTRHKKQICQMFDIIDQGNSRFLVEFNVQGEGYDKDKKTACIFLVTTPIGSHVFAIFLVLIGGVVELDNGSYKLVPEDAVIESKIVSEHDETIKNEDLVSESKRIEAKYDQDYSVVTMFNKN